MNELQAHDLIKKAIEADMAYRKAFVSVYKDNSGYAEVIETMRMNIGIGEQLLNELGHVCYINEFVNKLKSLKAHYHHEFEKTSDLKERRRVFGPIPMLSVLLEQAEVFVAAIDEEIDETEYVLNHFGPFDDESDELYTEKEVWGD